MTSPLIPFDRGCVKTISLFLSVGIRSTKSVFSQWFAPLTYFLAKKPSEPAAIYHSDIWNLGYHTASARSGRPSIQAV